jgi:type III pantothenate kinase
MNLITVDVGNTSTAVGLWSDGRVSRTSRWVGDRDAAMRAAKRLQAHSAAGLAYLSVVPGEDAAWRSFAERENIDFLEVSAKMFKPYRRRTCGLKLDYPRPETIGADRLADAAAALSRYGAPVIVCDFGTAFTAAVITRDGVWRGGAIAPGFSLMSDYFFERTAKLPRMKLGGKCPAIGRSTLGAMRFGAMAGYGGMVREIVGRLSRNFGGGFRLVATGGFAKWALDGTGMDFIVDPTLTLHGAGLLAADALEKKGKTR